VKDLVECTFCADWVPYSEVDARGRCEVCRVPGSEHASDYFEQDLEEEERWRCAMPGRCLMMGWHLASECHDAEMMAEAMRESYGGMP
jgi:hypothetical protein